MFLSRFFRNRPIRQKLNILVGLVMSLAFAGTFFTVTDNESRMLEGEAGREAMALAKLVAANATTSIAFQDSGVAGDILAALASSDNVLAGVIFNDDKTALAYKTFRADAASLPLGYPTTVEYGYAIEGNWLKAFVPVQQNSVHSGDVLLLLDLTGYQQQIQQNLLYTGSVFILSFVLAFALVSLLQRYISTPLAALTQLMGKVSQEQDYGLRAEVEGRDEIGRLAQGFNAMLDLIHARTAELELYQGHLESLVQERTRELIDAKEAAETASRIKSEFLANMSHELRTPLAGVIGLLEVMKDTPLDSTQQGYMSKAYGAAEMLLSVINDILDFSKIEAGRLELEQIDFNVVEVVEQCAAIFAESAHSRGLEMICSVPDRVDSFLRGDPVRLRQVLSNLIGNAVKFTEYGEVCVALNILQQDEQTAAVAIAVRDTGIGIPQNKLSHLFDAFTQADGSTTRRYGGTGLGLTIVKKLVALMGGEVVVESEVGKGTVFTLTLRLPRGALHTAHYEPLPGKRVLVVDDNANNRLILQRYLEFWQVLPDSEGDPLQALQRMRTAKAQSRPYDMVLLDFQMPGMDGLALAKAIHSEAELCTTEMVMLSSVPLSQREVQQVGIRAFLMKPVQKAELYRVLTLRPEAVQPQPLPSAAAGGLRLLLVEDNPTNQEVARAMLTKLGHTVDIAGDGEEALRYLQNHRVDCVLMDCLMPKMDGYEATQAIRAREYESGSGRRLPIIALTANALRGDRERCLAAGMDDYLSKPFKREQIQEKLQQWVAAAAVVVPEPAVLAVASPAQPAAELSFGDLLDADIVAELKSLLGDDLAGFLEKFREACQKQLADAREALAQGDGQALYRALHTLKGSAGAIGALGLVQACLELEQRAKAGDLANADAALSGIERLAQAVEQRLPGLLAG
jgi:signal transduction histidine kinase/CheY-like chemotaxis protein/HPt (histidine-containing phosphotransfer) domain-containing protein